MGKRIDEVEGAKEQHHGETFEKCEKHLYTEQARSGGVLCQVGKSAWVHEHGIGLWHGVLQCIGYIRISFRGSLGQTIHALRFYSRVAIAVHVSSSDLSRQPSRHIYSTWLVFAWIPCAPQSVGRPCPPSPRAKQSKSSRLPDRCKSTILSAAMFIRHICNHVVQLQLFW